MPKDLKLIWDNNYAESDLKYDNNAGDLYTDEGLETAVIISLFTDQRAEDDDTLPDPDSEDKRGWWGDQISDIENDEIGSRLWLHTERAKITQNTMNEIKQDVINALEWMKTDEVVANIEVEVEKQRTDMVAIEVKIKKKDGNTVSYKFDSNWYAQVNDN